MSRELLCAYGNCEERMETGKDYKITVTETRNGGVNDRQSYCCLEHAWRAIKAKDDRINHRRPAAA